MLHKLCKGSTLEGKVNCLKQNDKYIGHTFLLSVYQQAEKMVIKIKTGS